MWRFGALEAIMREIDMEWEMRDCLAEFSKATVFNMDRSCAFALVMKVADETGRRSFPVHLRSESDGR